MARPPIIRPRTSLVETNTYLLTEDGDYLLCEDGSRIVVEGLPHLALFTPRSPIFGTTISSASNQYGYALYGTGQYGPSSNSSQYGPALYGSGRYG